MREIFFTIFLKNNPDISLDGIVNFNNLIDYKINYFCEYVLEEKQSDRISDCFNYWKEINTKINDGFMELVNKHVFDSSFITKIAKKNYSYVEVGYYDK